MATILNWHPTGLAAEFVPVACDLYSVGYSTTARAATMIFTREGEELHLTLSAEELRRLVAQLG